MNFKLFSAEGKLNAFGNDHQYPPPQLMSLGSEGLEDHVLALMLNLPRYLVGTHIVNQPGIRGCHSKVGRLGYNLGTLEASKLIRR
jgi:hypothetical protein